MAARSNERLHMSTGEHSQNDHVDISSIFTTVNDPQQTEIHPPTKQKWPSSCIILFWQVAMIYHYYPCLVGMELTVKHLPFHTFSSQSLVRRMCSIGFYSYFHSLPLFTVIHFMPTASLLLSLCHFLFFCLQQWTVELSKYSIVYKVTQVTSQ